VKEATNYLTKCLKKTKPVVATQAAAPQKIQPHGILQRLDVMILAFAVTGVNLRNVVEKIYKQLKSNLYKNIKTLISSLNKYLNLKAQK
jgi:hypothetical protein